MISYQWTCFFKYIVFSLFYRNISRHKFLSSSDDVPPLHCRVSEFINKHLLLTSAPLMVKLMPNCHHANSRVNELNASVTTVTKLVTMLRNTHVLRNHYYVAKNLIGNRKSSNRKRTSKELTRQPAVQLRTCLLTQFGLGSAAAVRVQGFSQVDWHSHHQILKLFFCLSFFNLLFYIATHVLGALYQSLEFLYVNKAKNTSI